MVQSENYNRIPNVRTNNITVLQFNQKTTIEYQTVRTNNVTVLQFNQKTTIEYQTLEQTILTFGILL
jgi:hypothetical protein